MPRLECMHGAGRPSALQELVLTDQGHTVVSNAEYGNWALEGRLAHPVQK